MAGMPVARTAIASDLPSLLDLFRVSEVSPAAEPMEQAIAIWDETLAQPGTAVFISEQQGRVVATCMLVTAPNLLRGGRRHAFLENVMTHPDYRGMGHGSAVVSAALDRASQWNCHHVLLQSGRPDGRVHRFYEKLGFRPGLRTAYVCGRDS
jgi:GNAT superfamily N-acetyltransferase